MSLKYIFLCQLFRRTTQKAHLKDTFQGRNKPTQKIHQLCEHSLAIKFLQRRRELLLCRQCGSVQQKQALLQNNKKFKDNKSLRHLIFKPICVKYITSVAMNVRTPMQVASEAKNFLLSLLLLFYTHPKTAQYHGNFLATEYSLPALCYSLPAQGQASTWQDLYYKNNILVLAHFF